MRGLQITRNELGAGHHDDTCAWSIYHAGECIKLAVVIARGGKATIVHVAPKTFVIERHDCKDTRTEECNEFANAQPAARNARKREAFYLRQRLRSLRQSDPKKKATAT